jgi:Fe-S cluster assembly ATPase SufC
MVDGRIVKTGDKKLALHVEETGYKDFLQLGKEKH